MVHMCFFYVFVIFFQIELSITNIYSTFYFYNNENSFTYKYKGFRNRVFEKKLKSKTIVTVL